jgi:hypothetical protein
MGFKLGEICLHPSNLNCWSDRCKSARRGRSTRDTPYTTAEVSKVCCAGQSAGNAIRGRFSRRDSGESLVRPGFGDATVWADNETLGADGRGVVMKAGSGDVGPPRGRVAKRWTRCRKRRVLRERPGGRQEPGSGTGRRKYRC